MVARARHKPTTEPDGAGERPERALWRGSISFGLVDIPVVLQAVEVANPLDFDLIDERDHAPIGYRKVNKVTGKEVAATDIVRAMRTRQGKYVALTDEEIRKAHPEATRTIEVLQFVDPAEIEPAFYARPYYVKPARKEAKSFVLLREVLRQSRRVAIATIVLRARQHLAALMPQDELILLDLLRYADEMRQPTGVAQLGLAAARKKLTRAEIEMANRLVEGMAGSWEPARHADTYRKRILELVREKEKTGFVKAGPEVEAPAGGRIVDLMASLKRSLENAQAAPKSHRNGGHARRRTSG